MLNKLIKYYKIVALSLLILFHLFFLFNPQYLISYSTPYILLNIIIVLFFIFVKTKIIELKEYINASVVEIYKELLLGKIEPLNTPVNIQDIKEFIDAINKLVVYLNKKNKTAQEFNSNVSHELKAPLSELRADLEYFLYYSSLNNDIADKVKHFIKRINNLETVTSQMLFVSNNNVKKLNNNMQRVLLNDIVYEVIEDKKQLLQEKEMNLQTNINQAISMHGHKELLKHAIANILDNAIKYSAHKQNICISLKAKENHIYLIVQDNGTGIKKRDIKLIFHPYYRGENAISNITGYGIGLSLASWIFELHSAKIRIRSTYNKGTMIFIKFYLI